MKYNCNKPREIVIIFTEKAGKNCRKPLHIQRCTKLETGKWITVTYLAKDNHHHKHKYHHSSIMLISSREEIMYNKVHNYHSNHR